MPKSVESKEYVKAAELSALPSLIRSNSGRFTLNPYESGMLGCHVIGE